MKLSTTRIREGGYEGDEVWVCHYLQIDIHKKPLRNVPPTKCIILPKEGLPNNRTMHYTTMFFSILSKKGLPTSKVLSPVDNTGYKQRPGNELHVFDNEAECIECWNSQLAPVIDEVEQYKAIIDVKITTLRNKMR